MKVLIVDYSISILEAAEEMLFETGNIIYLHKALSYTRAIDFYKKINPDFVLLDVCRSSGNLSKISKEIKKRCFQSYIIILAVEDDNYLQEPSSSHGVYLFFDKYSEFEKMSRKIVSTTHPGHKILKPGYKTMRVSNARPQD